LGEDLGNWEEKPNYRKLVPKMDLNADGFIEENELREHINFMQKRYVVSQFAFHLGQRRRLC